MDARLPVDPEYLAAAVERAFAAAGTAADLSRKLGLTYRAAYKWRRIPAERVREVSRITGIPPHELRPDIFDPPATGGSANHAGVA